MVKTTQTSGLPWSAKLVAKYDKIKNIPWSEELVYKGGFWNFLEKYSGWGSNSI